MEHTGQCLDTLAKVLAEENQTPEEMIQAIREATEPLHHVTVDALEATDSLVFELRSDRPLTPLLHALTEGAEALTEVYVVPMGGRAQSGDWTLPELRPRSEIPFRRALVSIMETRVSEALLDEQKQACNELMVVSESLSEFERMVPFNRELAIGDLANLDSSTIPMDVRTLIEEMLVGALQRSHQKLTQIHTAHGTWSDALFQRFQNNTLQEVETLRSAFVSGSLDALGARLKQEADSSKLFRRDGRGVLGIIDAFAHWLGHTTASIIGPSRLHEWKAELGLLPPPEPRPLTAKDFEPTQPGKNIPVVYRRLFSDRALEAGDLLSGRQQLFQDCLEHLLSSDSGRLRSVAVVGQQGVGKRSLSTALSRKFPRVIELELSAPCTQADWDTFIGADGKGLLFVVPKLKWLRTTGQTDFVSKLIEKIISDNGENAFLIVADSPHWQFMQQTSALSNAIGFCAELTPLGVEDLSEALLTRHNMSGYDLAFPQSQGLPNIITKLWPRLASRNLQQEARWFEALHTLTHGVMQDATIQWLHAIEEFQENEATIKLGVVSPVNQGAYAHLSEPMLLTVRHLMRLGWLTVDDHTADFGMTNPESKALLEHLRHYGLVHETQQHYTLDEHHEGPLFQELQRRGWL